MARPAPSLVLATVAFALLGGCGDEGPTMTIGTYNAGLAARFVDYAEQRAPEVIATLPAAAPDILCVQEVWEGGHWDQLSAAMATTHPASLRLDDSQELGPAACAPGELDDLQVCVDMHCADTPAAMLVNCVLENCRTDLGSVNEACQSCLIANVGSGDLPTIRGTCEMDDVPLYAYDGSFGTGLLSRYDFTETDTLVLESTATRRALLYARIPDSPRGELHVFCTHLTSNLSSVPYTGTADNWVAEQAAQVATTLAWIEMKTGGSGQRILMGDLNSGPALPGITPELPDNYALWEAGGFRNPYASQADAVCTYCDDNPLNLGTMGGEGGLIDHTLLMGVGGSASSRRFMDGTVEIDDMGMTVTTAYSDHYGLITTLGD